MKAEWDWYRIEWTRVVYTFKLSLGITSADIPLQNTRKKGCQEISLLK